MLKGRIISAAVEVTRVAAGVCAVLLLLVQAVLVIPFSSQIGRDNRCRDEVHAVVDEIENFRRERGRLPSESELLPRPNSMPLTDYAVGGRRAEELREAGARSRDDYMLRFWRGEWMVFYRSWTKEDTCDSGAWTGVLVVHGTGLSTAALLLWITRRLRTPQRQETR